MLARVPWVKPVAVKLRPRKINRDRRKRLVTEVALILKTGEPTKFAFEASCRHGLRSALCLEGWNWAEADRVAAEIVVNALMIIGARRPTWQQGQPEWTQPGALPIQREQCIRCRKKLPKGHYKFCSKICSNGYHADRANAAAASERLATHETERAAGKRRK